MQRANALGAPDKIYWTEKPSTPSTIHCNHALDRLTGTGEYTNGNNKTD